ncbi:hypothetical protein FQZ97_660430 [compost metagenome]
MARNAALSPPAIEPSEGMEGRQRAARSPPRSSKGISCASQAAWRDGQRDANRQPRSVAKSRSPGMKSGRVRRACVGASMPGADSFRLRV